MYDIWLDRQMVGHMEDQLETIISRHYCVAGIKISFHVFHLIQKKSNNGLMTR